MEKFFNLKNHHSCEKFREMMDELNERMEEMVREVMTKYEREFRNCWNEWFCGDRVQGIVNRYLGIIDRERGGEESGTEGRVRDGPIDEGCDFEGCDFEGCDFEGRDSEGRVHEGRDSDGPAPVVPAPEVLAPKAPDDLAKQDNTSTDEPTSREKKQYRGMIKLTLEQIEKFKIQSSAPVANPSSTDQPTEPILPKQKLFNNQPSSSPKSTSRPPPPRSGEPKKGPRNPTPTPYKLACQQMVGHEEGWDKDPDERTYKNNLKLKYSRE